MFYFHFNKWMPPFQPFLLVISSAMKMKQQGTKSLMLSEEFTETFLKVFFESAG